MTAPGLLVALAAAASAGLLAVWIVAAAQASRRPRVVCLMYHRAAQRSAYARLRGEERVFTLPEESFDEQLGWLSARGHQFVSADDVAAFARGERTLDDASVLITIDDGCASAHARMLPVLRRHGAPAVLFVTTDPAAVIFREAGDENRRVTDEEIRVLAAAGVAIGSHAVSHRPLSVMSESEIRHELVASKRALEEVTGGAVRHFAVPANWYDDRVLRIAREAGYDTVFCSRPDTVREGTGAFGIARINVEGHLDLAGFERALSPRAIAQRRLVLALRGLPKRVVGPRAWEAIRRDVLPRIGADRLSPSRMGTAVAIAIGGGLLAALGWLLLRGG